MVARHSSCCRPVARLGGRMMSSGQSESSKWVTGSEGCMGPSKKMADHLHSRPKLLIPVPESHGYPVLEDWMESRVIQFLKLSTYSRRLRVGEPALPQVDDG